VADRLDGELTRLRALGVLVSFLPSTRALALRRRMAEVFVVSEAIARVTSSEGIVPFESLLRLELRKPKPLGSAIEWLARRDQRWEPILRFDRREPRAITVEPRSFEPTWMLSWPGLYVANDLRRLIAVGVDYDVVFCDAVLRPQPYR
jgi:hypothetical protein